jgi:Ca2+-transporting ATPase
MDEKRWHTLDAGEAFRLLDASPEGLPEEEAAQRLALYGPNAIAEGRRRSSLSMLAAQFRDFSILVLLGAALLAAVVGDLADAAPVVVIVVLNALIGFVQEYRAEASMEALRKMAGQAATLRRDGRERSLPATEIVPGDVVLLETGAIVPADLRLVEAARLQVEEAALTGESVPVEKGVLPLPEGDAPLADRTCMAYKGTVVTRGRAVGVAVATGEGTELGRIASLLRGEKEEGTPLQRRLALFGKRLALVIVALCSLLFVVGTLRGVPPLAMALTAVSLAVAAIPEALPAVVTIALAFGARRMVRRNALLRRLPAVETLGSVTTICTDKTGTLTLNRMTVERVYLAGAGSDGWGAPPPPPAEGAPSPSLPAEGRSAAEWLELAAALCGDARRNGEGRLVGDPTETALVAWAEGRGLDPAAAALLHPRTAELPFDADRKRMTTVHRAGDLFVSFTKGSVEGLASRAAGELSPGGVVHPDRKGFAERAERLAREGYRTLGIAMRRWEREPDSADPDGWERELVLLGVVGILDPPRPEAAEAIAQCRRAGIRTVMITGDHPVTARVIAERLGILAPGEILLTGQELDALPPDRFSEVAGKVSVYARSSPEQKLRIVETLKGKGEIVAMTGDGVNDAPALRRADIGVAMGVTGTDVAREASSMVLLDDDFSTIVRAVREGRRIYANILRYITYSVTCNAGTLWLIVLAPFLALPLPLLPVQILWLNLLCDGLPGLALTAEETSPGVMDRPPVDPEEGVFSGGRGAYMLRYGLLLGASALLLEGYALREGRPFGTLVFTYLIFSRMAVALAVRSRSRSLFRMGILSNRPLAGAVLLTVVLQSAVVYVPFLNRLFSTEPLTAAEYAALLAAAAAVFAVFEAEKGYRRLARRRSRSSR